jgi:3',5'-cyclic AMP phosphodiesterase CpdA
MRSKGVVDLSRDITRRGFITKIIGGMALFAGGYSISALWPISGSEKGSIRLVFYTDVHARTEWDTPKAMALAANNINAINPDFVINGGDLITDGFNSSEMGAVPRWHAYMQMQQAIKADVYSTIGNHDLVGASLPHGIKTTRDPRAVFQSQMGLQQTYYSFDAVGYHFIILDAIDITGDKYRYRGYIWPEEMEWLKQDLAKVRLGTPVIVVTHIPLLTSFYAATKGSTIAAPKNRVIINNDKVLNVLKKHNVVLVLQGHLHVKELIKWQGISFIVGGAISGKWWRGPYYGAEEGFNIITMSGNRAGWEYIDYGWTAKRPINK